MNEGQIRAELEAVKAALSQSTADIAAISDWRACTFEVTDESGSLVLTLPVAEVRA